MGFTAYPETEQELHQPEAQTNPTAELFGTTRTLASDFQELSARGVDVIPASPFGVTTLTDSGSHLTVRQTELSESSPGTQDSPDGVLAAAAMCCVEKLCIVGGACPTGKDVKDYTQAELDALSAKLSVSSRKSDFNKNTSEVSTELTKTKGPDPHVIEAFASRFKAVAQMKKEGELKNSPETEAQIQARAQAIRDAEKNPQKPEPTNTPDSSPQQPTRVIPDHLKRFQKPTVTETPTHEPSRITPQKETPVTAPAHTQPEKNQASDSSENAEVQPMQLEAQNKSGEISQYDSTVTPKIIEPAQEAAHAQPPREVAKRDVPPITHNESISRKPSPPESGGEKVQGTSSEPTARTVSTAQEIRHTKTAHSVGSMKKPAHVVTASENRSQEPIRKRKRDATVSPLQPVSASKAPTTVSTARPENVSAPRNKDYLTHHKPIIDIVPEPNKTTQQERPIRTQQVIIPPQENNPTPLTSSPLREGNATHDHNNRREKSTFSQDGQRKDKTPPPQPKTIIAPKSSSETVTQPRPAEQSIAFPKVESHTAQPETVVQNASMLHAEEAQPENQMPQEARVLFADKQDYPDALETVYGSRIVNPPATVHREHHSNNATHTELHVLPEPNNVTPQPDTPHRYVHEKPANTQDADKTQRPPLDYSQGQEYVVNESKLVVPLQDQRDVSSPIETPTNPQPSSTLESVVTIPDLNDVPSEANEPTRASSKELITEQPLEHVSSASEPLSENAAPQNSQENNDALRIHEDSHLIQQSGEPIGIESENPLSSRVQLDTEISGSIFSHREQDEKTETLSPLVIHITGEKEDIVQPDRSQPAEQHVDAGITSDQVAILDEVRMTPAETEIIPEPHLGEESSTENLDATQLQNKNIENPQTTIESVTIFSHVEHSEESQYEQQPVASAEKLAKLEVMDTLSVHTALEYSHENTEELHGEEPSEAPRPILLSLEDIDFAEILTGAEAQQEIHQPTEQYFDDEVSEESFGEIFVDAPLEDQDHTVQDESHKKPESHIPEVEQIDSNPMSEEYMIGSPEFLEFTVQSVEEITQLLETHRESYEEAPEPIMYLMFAEEIVPVDSLDGSVEDASASPPQTGEHLETHHEEQNKPEAIRVLSLTVEHLTHVVEQISDIHELLKEFESIEEYDLEGIFDTLFDASDEVTPEELRNDNAGQYDDTVVVLWYAITIMRMLGIAMIYVNPNSTRSMVKGYDSPSTIADPVTIPSTIASSVIS